MRSGRKSEAQTPSPKKDRIKGSKVNPKGSASSTKSAKSIELSDSITTTLENKRDEYNAKHPNKKVTLATLKAVFRRGAGAFSSSHRPNMTRSGWAFARVNKFLLKRGGTKVKAAYVQDDDLMERGGLIEALTTGIENLNQNGIVLKDKGDTITLIAYNTGNQKRESSLYNKALIYSSVQPIKSANEIIQSFDLQEFEMFSEGKMEEYKKSHLIIMNQNEVVYDSSVLAEGGDLGQEITCVNCGWHWNTNNSDEFDKYVCHKCGFDNRTYYDSDPIGEYHLGGDMSLHLAPNGKPSNLTHEQWHLVRTPEFKAWFGDWERLALLKIKDSGIDDVTLNNISKDISKVVDENGEPLVVYHATNNDFNEFRIVHKYIYQKIKRNWSIGSHFGTLAQAKQIADEIPSFSIKPYFLNIKDLKRVYDYQTWTYKDWESNLIKLGYIKEGNLSFSKIYKIIENEKFEGFVYENNYEGGGDSYIVLNPKSIKLADGSNTTFDANSPDIRYKDGGLTFSDEEGLYLIIKDVKQENRYKGAYKKIFDIIEDSVSLYNPYGTDYEEIKGSELHIYITPRPDGYIIEEIKRLKNVEITDSDISKYHLGGDMSKHLAPNGKPSNLTHEQWHLVRTPEFKAWFGDWERLALLKIKDSGIDEVTFNNISKDISKVVDENGEPLVVYHGSVYGGINIFDINESKRIGSGLKEYGSFFTTNLNIAQVYRSGGRYTKENDEERRKEISKLEKLLDTVKSNREYKEIEKEIDKWYSKIYEVFLNLKNVKVFDANFGTNKSGYYNLEVDAGYKIANGNDAILFLKDGRFGVEKVDGIVANNIIELSQKPSDWEDYVGTSFLVFNETPQYIKLADGRNTTFDGNNPDIRFEDGGNLYEQAQIYIDIISMNPTLEKYQKYKDILKNNFGIDYDVEYGDYDEKLIEDANLDDIKYKDDFLNYDNYVKYANKIFKLRGFINNQPTHIEGIVNIDLASKIGEELGFYVELKPYTGSGNYAEALGKVIRMPNEVDVNIFIHEIGHFFDHQYSNEYDGDAKNSTYATSVYEVRKPDEVFAENFMTYFIAPTWLKNNMPNVYYELHEKIPENYKNTINNLIHQVGYKEGGNLPVGKLAKGMTEEEVAQIHGLHEKDIKNELLLGIEQEMEHTDNPIYAKAIALDHLYENPKYYTKLKEMEKSFKNGGYFSERYPKNEYIQLSNDDVYDFKEDIFNIINSSYAYIGGHIEFQKPDDIVNSDLNFWIGADIDEDPEVDTMIGGKTTNFGTKLTTSAQDGSRNAKISVMKKMGELLATKGFYAEINVDLAIKRGGKWETDEEIIRKVVNKPDIVMNEDGSYTRSIGGHPHTKVLVGYFDHLKEKKYKRGGELDPDNKGVKDYFAGGSGSTGGVLVGKRHSEGGIKAINKATNTPIEMEGGEVVITRNAVSDNKKREFEGQMLTNKEILSKINVSGGGVSLYEDGGKVGCSFCTGKKYKYGGEMVSDYQIYDEVMRSGGDLALDRKYGSISYQDSNDIDDYNYDEQEIIYHFLRTDADYVYIDKDNVRNIKGLIDKGLFNYRETNGNYNVEVYPTKLGKKVLSEMPVEAFKRGGNLSNRKNIIIDTNDGRSKRKKLEDYYASIQEDKQFASGGTIDGLEDLSSCSRSFLVDMKNSGLEYLDYSADRKKEIKDLEDNDLIYFTNSSSFGCVTAFLTKKGKKFISSVPTHLFKKGGINDCGCGCGSYKDGGETDAEKKYFKGVSYDYENQFLVNKAIEELLNMKDSNDMTIDEKNFLTYYSGYGGLEKYGASGKGLLYEYFTPSLIAKKMWALAYKHGFEGGFVLEPSCGIGEFIKYAPEQQMVQGYEINETSAKICKILYPKSNIKVEPFEKMFIKNNYTIKGNINGMNKYSLVIGNPPYGSMGGLYAGMGEKDYAKANNYIDYFILRGLDLLQSGGLLVFIIGVEVAAGGNPYLEQGVTENKKLVSKIADLVDAYRLPNGVFERTDVLTDIVVFKKK